MDPGANMDDVLAAMQQQIIALQAALQQQPPQPAGIPFVGPLPAPVAAPAQHSRPKPPESFDNTKRGYTVEDFLFQLDLFFQLSHTADADKVAFTGTRLSGNPLVWFRTHNPVHMDYDDFVEELLAEFLPLNAVRDARDALASIKQEGTVRSYLSRFRFLCARIPNLSEDEKLDRFMRGLDKRLRLECELRDVDSVDAAARLAERVQATYRGNGFGDTPQHHNHNHARHHRQHHARSHASHTGPAPMELGAVKLWKDLTGPQQQRLSRLQKEQAPLSKEDRDFLAEVGGCFYCRQLGHTKPNCPSKNDKGGPSSQKPRQGK